jgi:KDO2-lipid IV(A) lauroyltransferase
MWTLGTFPLLARALRPLILGLTWRHSYYLREHGMAYAGFVLGSRATDRQRADLARAVIANHFEFLYDFGRMRKWSCERLRGEIECIEGEAYYEQVRRLGRGLIVVTAHVGSFEVALAGLRAREEHVHVVYKHNPHEPFERLRSDQRRRIGVREAAVDDGIDMWMRLRDALRRDEVVLMQGDRVMPPAHGLEVPFLGGLVELPVGPAKLAAASGAPILPVLSVRLPSRRLRIIIKEPIQVDAPESGPFDPGPVTRRIGAVLEQHIRAFPDQWLAAHSVPIKACPTPAGAPAT